MSIAVWFGAFCSNICIKDDSSISTRYKAITRRLNTDFWSTTSDTAHSLYVGSYGRNTATVGFSDLDMLFQLPYSEYVRYEPTALRWTSGPHRPGCSAARPNARI